MEDQGFRKEAGLFCRKLRLFETDGNVSVRNYRFFHVEVWLVSEIVLALALVWLFCKLIGLVWLFGTEVWLVGAVVELFSVKA